MLAIDRTTRISTSEKPCRRERWANVAADGRGNLVSIINGDLAEKLTVVMGIDSGSRSTGYRGLDVDNMHPFAQSSNESPIYIVKRRAKMGSWTTKTNAGIELSRLRFMAERKSRGAAPKTRSNEPGGERIAVSAEVLPSDSYAHRAKARLNVGSFKANVPIAGGVIVDVDAGRRLIV